MSGVGFASPLESSLTDATRWVSRVVVGRRNFPLVLWLRFPPKDRYISGQLSVPRPSRYLLVYALLLSCVLSSARSCGVVMGSGLAWDLGVRVFTGRRSSTRPGKDQWCRPEGLVRTHAARISVRPSMGRCLSGHTFRARCGREDARACFVDHSSARSRVKTPENLAFQYPETGLYRCPSSVYGGVVKSMETENEPATEGAQ